MDDLSGRVLEAGSMAANLLELQEGALVGRVFPVGLDDEGGRALIEHSVRCAATRRRKGQVTTGSGDPLSIGITA